MSFAIEARRSASSSTNLLDACSLYERGNLEEEEEEGGEHVLSSLVESCGQEENRRRRRRSRGGRHLKSKSHVFHGLFSSLVA